MSTSDGECPYRSLIEIRDTLPRLKVHSASRSLREIAPMQRSPELVASRISL